jgi:putative nucleotidyltransferase with HDIG domain
VNAPFFGLGRRISSIQHAVLLLGVRTVRNLVLSAVLVKSFGESSRDRRFDRGRLWRHTVACAAGARMLSRRLGGGDPEEAFLAGLVHDMGIVVFDQFFHDGFRRVADLATGMGMPLIAAEREVFGSDHAFVGRQLARRWNFPAAVAEAIGCHHEPGRARLVPILAATVHLADWLEGAAEIAPEVPVASEAEGVTETGPVSVPASGPEVGADARTRADGAEPAANGEDVQRGPAEAIPADPFCASGPLDPLVLEMLGLRLQDLEGLRLAVAEERLRTEALMSLLP